jgi:hypothetical protein
MDSYLEVTLTEYGFAFSSGPVYLSLDWVAVITIVAIISGYKFYKRYWRKDDQDEFYAV